MLAVLVRVRIVSARPAGCRRCGAASHRLTTVALAAVIGTAAIQLAVVYWSRPQELLSTEPLTLTELALAAFASTGVYWAVEVEKAVRRRHIDQPAAETDAGQQ